MGSAVYRKYLMIGAVTLPFTLLALFMNDVLRVTFQPWKFIGLNLTQALVTFVAALWLVVQRHMGVAGVLYAKLAGDAVASLLGLALIRLSGHPRVRSPSAEANAAVRRADRAGGVLLRDHRRGGSLLPAAHARPRRESGRTRWP